MSRYKEGLSIDKLRERYLDDVAQLPPEEVQLLYGRDKPRFLGEDATVRMRPTSFHLRTPLYEDQQGRQYTPDAEPRTDRFWLRIPPRFVRRFHKDPDAAEAAAATATSSASSGAVPWREFPRADDQLVLRYVRYGREHNEATVSVRVHYVSTTQAVASAFVVFDQEINSLRPDSQQSAMAARVSHDRAQRQRRAERADRIYDK